MEAVSEWLTPIFIGFVSAYFGSLIAVRRFKKERLWERREKAYAGIIDALYDMLRHCEIHKEDYGQGTGYSDDRESEFRESYTEAYWKLKKVTDIGAFVISPRAHAVLVELRNREKLSWDDNPRFDIYEHEYECFRVALEKIVRIASNELNTEKV
ncbi:hypothetical protein K7H08_14870 [Halomonas sp. IOP_6]|uniref:hypothetical protein n=1 Tax=Halomonas sp. IOP_6 TaxID=2876583 RepID=UPI001E60A22D|nr:hypothetical protein [Halomonas sp. IOP_6]MCD6006121.1 hypothetical protein [Halomonas sp. IOP_6]